MITLKVIPRARKNLWKEENGLVKVWLTAPPVEGKANTALIAFLSDHYGVSKSRIEIIKGLNSRNKTIKISEIC